MDALSKTKTAIALSFNRPPGAMADFARHGPRRLFGRLVLVLGAGIQHAALAAWTLGFAGAGPLQIGMTLEQVNRALGASLHPPEVSGADPSGRCFQDSPAQPAGVVLMFQDEILVRIDITRPGVRSAAGIGVGRCTRWARR